MTKNDQAGFTLLEAMIAAAIFLIGILALYGMQWAAVKENVSANNITAGSTWAAAKVEELINLPYTHAQLQDGQGTNLGCAGLNDWPDPKLNPKPKADGSVAGTTNPAYNIYWNVAKDCVLVDIPPSSSEIYDHKPKQLRIIVTRQNRGGQEVQAAVFDYTKQHPINLSTN